MYIVLTTCSRFGCFNLITDYSRVETAVSQRPRRLEITNMILISSTVRYNTPPGTLCLPRALHPVTSSLSNRIGTNVLFTSGVLTYLYTVYCVNAEQRIFLSSVDQRADLAAWLRHRILFLLTSYVCTSAYRGIFSLSDISSWHFCDTGCCADRVDRTFVLFSTRQLKLLHWIVYNGIVYYVGVVLIAITHGRK